MRIRKKNYLSAFLLSCCLVLSFFTAVQADEPAGREKTPEELTQLYARSAVLMDAESGRVLFSKNGNEMLPMASTTKIMTCILALEKGDLNASCSVSLQASSQPQVRLGVKEGETYRLEDLLYSLMLESHNDSAVVIAETIAGSVEKFAEIMNAKAKEIGCSHTYFITPNGLDAENNGKIHATTAEDLALILRYCILKSPEKENFLKITGTRDYRFSDDTGARNFSVHNHNAFLDMMEGALTGKTGFTADAGYCYVGALENDGRTYIVSLLACGWPNHKTYKWDDTKKLMQYGLDHYRLKKVTLHSSLPPLTVKNGVSPSGSLAVQTSVTLFEKTEKRELLIREDEDISSTITLSSSLSSPVKKGEKAGRVVYRIGEFVLAEHEVTAAEPVEKRTFLWSAERINERFFLASTKKQSQNDKIDQ